MSSEGAADRIDEDRAKAVAKQRRKGSVDKGGGEVDRLGDGDSLECQDTAITAAECDGLQEFCGQPETGRGNSREGSRNFAWRVGAAAIPNFAPAGGRNGYSGRFSRLE